MPPGDCQQTLAALLLWYIIPQIEKHVRLLQLFCAALVLGGIGRLISYLTVGPSSDAFFVGMFIELASPIFLIWQAVLIRKAKAA